MMGWNLVRSSALAAALFIACASDADDPASASGCASPPPSGCCCAIDVSRAYVCTDDKWQCPAGNYSVPESKCNVCPGPCCSFNPDASTQPDAPDAQGPDVKLDSPPDAPDADSGPQSIACDKLEAAWQAFLKNNLSFVNDTECVLVGGSTNYCNCAIAIGALGGDAISAKAVAAAAPYLDAFKACVASGYPYSCGWDHGPSTDVRCESGSCAKTDQYCGIDAGGG